MNLEAQLNSLESNNRNQHRDSVVVINDDDDDLIFVSHTPSNSNIPIIDLINIDSPLSRRNVQRNRVNIQQATTSTAPAPATVPTPSVANSSLNESIAGRPTCPICMESLFKNNPHSTICGHMFCRPCITQAVQISKKCPLCNKKLTAKGFHPVYF